MVSEIQDWEAWLMAIFFKKMSSVDGVQDKAEYSIHSVLMFNCISGKLLGLADGLVY